MGSSCCKIHMDFWVPQPDDEVIMMKRDSFLSRERGVMHNYKNVQLIYSYID